MRAEPSGVFWLWPTPLARDRWIARRAADGRLAENERIWCWDDLWSAVRFATTEGPRVLGASGARAVLRAAVEQAATEGELDAIGELADAPGFRRQLARRIGHWRSIGRTADRPPSSSRPVEAAEWRVFGRYLALLAEIGAEDATGLPSWAASRLRSIRPAPWAGCRGMILVDPPDGRPFLAAVDAMHKSGLSVLTILAGEADETRAEVFAESAALRGRLIQGRFQVERPEPSRRPAGLDAVERRLFGDEGEATDATGLRFLGTPAGEGVARAIAACVAARLEAGDRPDDVLIVVRQWDDQADRIAETMRAWGIAVAATPGRPLRLAHSLQGLRLALRLEASGWESDDLCRLLRHGRFRPRSAGPVDPSTRARAAAAVRDARVFRGLDALIEVLRRQAAQADDQPEGAAGAPDYSRRQRLRRADQARAALPILEWLDSRHEPLREAANWSLQVERLINLADDLGLASTEDPEFMELIAALDEQGEVATLTGGERSWHWGPFVAEVEAMLRELVVESASPVAGGVRIATVEEARGASARCVVLATLTEGSFPRRSAIRPDPVEVDPGSDDSAESSDQLRLDFDRNERIERPTPIGREMLAFLRVAASAGDELTLVYPTADEKGNRVLSAAFLDDVRALFDPDAVAMVTIEEARLDASLQDAVTGDPAERRIRAVARASLRGDPGELTEIARRASDASFVRALRETILLGHRRGRWSGRFTHFEGMLRDPRAVARIAAAFGPELPFSASQLESLVHCPFQFFSRYVLRLDPVDERDELDEDRTLRGSRVHAILQALHESLPGDAPDVLATVAERLPALIQAEFDGEPRRVSPVAAGLLRIEKKRLQRVGHLYVDQLRAYLEGVGKGSSCRGCEIPFGPGHGPDGSDRSLRLGEGERVVLLQGSIDRVDVVDQPAGPAFRVIDYKTSGVPSPARVKDGTALQLPLYALAVERLGLLESPAEPLDVGYWALRAGGFKRGLDLSANAKRVDASWDERSEHLIDLVLDWAAHLRRGRFPVRPSSTECTRSCDYSHVCRIGQVRSSHKSWPDAPALKERL